MLEDIGIWYTHCKLNVSAYLLLDTNDYSHMTIISNGNTEHNQSYKVILETLSSSNKINDIEVKLPEQMSSNVDSCVFLEGLSLQETFYYWLNNKYEIQSAP